MTATAKQGARLGRAGVVLMSENAAVRAGLRLSLDSGVDCYEARTAAEVKSIASQRSLDVCLIASDHPASALVAELSRAVPGTRIVVLSTDIDDSQLLDAVRAGAVGYLPASLDPERLPQVVQGVMHGEAAIPRMLVGRLIQELRDRAERRRVLLSNRGAIELSAREWEVLEQLRRRRRTKEIATSLGISEVTVRRHVGAILRKLEVADRDAAVQLVSDWKFV